MAFHKTSVIVCLFALLLFAGESMAATITVSNDTELQNALNTVAAGDTILFSTDGSSGRTIQPPSPSYSVSTSKDGFTLDGNVGSDGSTGKIQPPSGTNSGVMVDFVTHTITNLKNLSIQNVNSNSYYSPGGMRAQNISQAISNVEFYNNKALGDNGSGGGLWVAGQMTGSLAGDGKTVKFTGNSVAASGGGMYVDSGMTGSVLSGTSFVQNAAGSTGGMGRGGGLSVSDKMSGNVKGAVFDRNTSTHRGGGMYVGNGMSGDITETTFTNNIASGTIATVAGGGLAIDVVYIDSPSAPNPVAFTGTISNSSFTGNQSTVAGGGAFFSGDMAGKVSNVTFTSNKTGGYGGGMAILFGKSALSGEITGSRFDKNEATAGGGLTVTGDMKGKISDTSFTDNVGTITGGGAAFGLEMMDFDNPTAVAVPGGSVTGSLTSVQFLRNTSPKGNAGGMYAKNIDGGSITNSTFQDNTAAYNGGAIFVPENLKGNITGTTFKSNKAGLDTSVAAPGVPPTGGAISTGYFDGNITGSTFDSNSVEGGGHGGAIAVAVTAKGTIDGTTFKSNNAAQKGGAMYLARGSDLTIKNTEFSANTSGDKGGAIYFDTLATPNASGGSTPASHNVVLYADPGKTTSFTGNRDSSGRNSFHVGGTDAGASFNLSVKGGGTVNLTDPFSADIGASSFNLTHDAADTLLVMSGTNTVKTNGGNVGLNFISGTTRVTRDAGDFTLKVNGTTNTNMTWGKNNTLQIDRMEARPNTLAMIDLTGSTGTKKFTIEDGATLDIARTLDALPNQRYLIVDGLNPGSQSNPDMAQIGAIRLLHPNGYTKVPMFEQNGTQLWLDGVDIPSAFDPNQTTANVVGGEAGITNWLNGTPTGLSLTSEEVVDLRRDFHSGPPEAIVDMALIGTGIHDISVRTARSGFKESGYMYRDNTNALDENCMPLPLDCCLPQGGFRIWANYMGAIDHARDTNTYSGYNTHTNGALVGLVWKVSPAFDIGAYFGYSRSSVDFRKLSADADSEGIHTGIQAAWFMPWGMVVTADGSFSHQSIDMERSPGNLGTNTSSFGQRLYGAGVEVAWPFFATPRTRITPAASLDAIWVRQNEVRENGKIMAAHVDEIRGHSLFSRVGVAVEHDFLAGSGVITPGLGAYWKHRYSGRQFSANYDFLDNESTGFYARDTVHSRKLGKDSMELSAYFDASLNRGASKWSFRGGYTVDVSEHAVGHTFYGGIGVSF